MNAFTVELIPQLLARKLSTVIQGKEVGNKEGTTLLLSHNINNEIIIGYLLRIKKVYIKDIVLEINPRVAHLRV